MSFSICIIAKDEENTIGHLIEQLSLQTLVRDADRIEILVVSNGCTDRTAESARNAFSAAKWPDRVTTTVHEEALAGKARTWNLAVHHLMSKEAQIALFLDADIELADESVLDDLVDELRSNKEAVAVSGWPLKDIARNERKSFIDKFSLRVSSQTQYSRAINGSLYAAELHTLRKNWLPVPIPGEDGMLSALIKTEGFTQPANQALICRARQPTHFYEAHTVSGFFLHEQRMLLGTTINGWIFESFWKGRHTVHVGELVRSLNEMTPNWVSDLVAQNVGTGKWVLPRRLLFWRLDNLRNVSLKRAVLRAPFSLGATMLNIWPCIQANARLRKQSATSYW